MSSSNITPYSIPHCRSSALATFPRRQVFGARTPTRPEPAKLSFRWQVSLLTIRYKKYSRKPNKSFSYSKLCPFGSFAIFIDEAITSCNFIDYTIFEKALGRDGPGLFLSPISTFLYLSLFISWIPLPDLGFSQIFSIL